MLRYITATLTAGALAGTMSVFAQQQPPQQQPPQEQPPAQQPAAETTTLTGCVIEAKTTDGGTAYVLNKAQGGKAAMYVLLGPPPSELASHVNHKVEVTGQVQEPAAPPSSDDKKVLRPPMVQVESVKPVADTCE